MAFSVFELERIGKVARVSLDRPEKRNAMGPDFWPELQEVFVEAALDNIANFVIYHMRDNHI